MNRSAKTVALGGVMIALSITTLFLASFMPGVEMTLYAIASFYTAIIIMESGIKGGMAFYVVSSLLAFIIVPNKIALFPYVLFFGLYGIIKYYIEKIKKILPEIVLKLLFFNGMFACGLLLFKQAFLGNIELPDLAMPILIGAAQIVFLFYDYLFTLALTFYLKRKPKSQ